MIFMNKLIAKNPVAKHNYNIENTIEAGIVLTGTEIKSIRNGKVNLKDSYAAIKKGEVFITSPFNLNRIKFLFIHTCNTLGIILLLFLLLTLHANCVF